MPGATPSYPPEFKREAVRLVRSSPNRSVAQIAKELGVSDNSLRSWVKHLVMPLPFFRGAEQKSRAPTPVT